MGKRIISQARGHGSLTYRVRKQAYRYKIKYPMQEGEAEILSILHSPAHSAPLLKLKINNEVFFNSAFNGAFTGQKIKIGGNEVKEGSILMLKNVSLGSKVYNLELNPGDGGKMVRTAGGNATLAKALDNNKFMILMQNKKEIVLSGDCRVSIGTIAGDGRTLKPFIKAGKKNREGKEIMAENIIVRSKEPLY